MPLVPNMNFTAHELLQAHHAMQTVQSRQRFSPMRHSESRMGGVSSMFPGPSQQRHETKPPNSMPPPPPPPPSSSHTHRPIISTSPHFATTRNVVYRPPVTAAPPGIDVLIDVEKDELDDMLRDGKAQVFLETGKRVRSIVWLFMGRIKLLDSGLICNNFVACSGCHMTYKYKCKSQGTSTLRHHMCDFAFQIHKEVEERDRQIAHELGMTYEEYKKQKLHKVRTLKSLSNGDIITVTPKLHPQFANRKEMEKFVWNPCRNLKRRKFPFKSIFSNLQGVIHRNPFA